MTQKDEKIKQHEELIKELESKLKSQSQLIKDSAKVDSGQQAKLQELAAGIKK